MPLNPDLNFDLSPAQKAAIHAALDAILDVLSDPSNPYVNLTLAERKKTPSIDKVRMPYVQRSVNDILPLFPNLQSPSIPLDRSERLLHLVEFFASIAPKMAEIQDRTTDMGINAKHLLYKSMTDSYNMAQRQEGRMPGADVLLEALAPLFAKTKNPTGTATEANTLPEPQTD